MYYLIHNTNNWGKISKEGKLKCSRESGQFPGVYFSLVTEKNIDTQLFFPGKHILIFSLELLKQRNYHVNIQDMNGILSEKNTIYPWNLLKQLSKLDKFNSNLEMQANEVVFHDSIDLKYLCKVLKKPMNLNIQTSDVLPREVIINKHEPDMKLLPFYCYCNIFKYSGIKSKYSKPSSIQWFRKMAKVAGVDESGTKKEIIERIHKKAPMLRKKRHLQNIYPIMNLC
tara:strand:- start:987 stop:1667 length:681 start_codon:yes stop_codon:yes gene_type:complete